MEKSVVKRAEQSFKLHTELIDLMRAGTIAWLATGEYLLKMKKGNRFRDILGDPPAGSPWTWDDYIGMPEIGMKYSTCHKLMQMVEVFKEKLNLPDGELGKIRFYRLKMIAPHINEKNKETLLDAAEHLSRTDFEHALTKESKGIDSDECKHSWKEMLMRECSLCGKRTKNQAKNGIR